MVEGPRLAQELADQDALLPAKDALPFGPEEASLAAALYAAVSRPRGREMDLAIAACAIAREAAGSLPRPPEKRGARKNGMLEPSC